MIRKAFLFVVLPIVFGYGLGYSLAGCKEFMGEVNDASNEAASDGDKLKKCRTEARAEYYVGQKSVEESLAAYDACLKREGLQ